MATSLNASLNVTLNPQSLNASTKQVKQALGRITGQASEFQKSLDASTARVFAFGATTAVLNGVTQSFKKLVSTTIEVEKRLVEINSIFQATESTFNRFRTAIFQVAKETGQSFATVADGAAELARQGLSAEETAKRLKAGLVLTRISGLDAEKSVKALTAAINGFTSAGLTANQIVNKLVAVDTAFAVSAQDLAEAFSRAGSTAEDAGVSFDQLLGLVTAVEQKTARGGAVIGNAFKSIFTRLSRGTTIEELKELGVAIDATQSGIQKLSALSNALENISDPTVASKIKELAGGVFQINVVSAALKDLSSETSIFAGAAEVASTATNEAFEKNAALNKTIAAQINALVQGLTSLAEKIGTITFGPLVENLVGIATKFSEFLDKALDPEKGNVFIKGLFKAIGSFLGGPAVVIFTAAFIKIFKLVARFAAEGLKSLFTIGTQAERIKNIESGIVGLLQRDSSLRKLISSTTATQAQKEQAIIQAIRTENALLQQQASIMRSLSVAAASRGVTGVGSTGAFLGKGGRRFNSGFRAEEAEAMMLGATPSVRAHMGKGTIGGQRFIMNNQEDEIPNFAGGKDSAVIPRYPKGFVPNYSRQNLLSIINSKQPVGSRFHKTAKQKEAARAKLAEMDARAAKKENMTRLPLTGAGKGMFVPILNYKNKVSPHKGFFMKGKTRIPYDLQGGFKVRGPQLPHGVDAAGDPEDDRLKDNVIKDIAKRSRQFSNTLTPVTKRNAASTSEIKNALMTQGGGKGAIHAAVGAAFEAAIVTGLRMSNLIKKDGGDFDVRPVTEKIRELFYGEGQAKATALGDFKASDSEPNRVSFIKKIANEKYGNKTSNMLAALGRKAAGYVPNFVKGNGVPTSLMRVHKDKKGSPVAVTNLRDEPNGLQDAIKRERKGIGMFSSGFIPNYADQLLVKDKSGEFVPVGKESGAKGGGEAKVSKANDKLAAKADKTGAALGGLTMGLFALQGVLGTVTASHEQNISSIESETDKRIQAAKESNKANKESFSELQKNIAQIKKEGVERSHQVPTMVKLADAANKAATALITLSTLNMLTGGGLGKGAKGLLMGGKKGAGKRFAQAGKFGAAGNKAARNKALMSAGGKLAGRLGVVGALGFGAFEGFKTLTDDSLEKKQKSARLKETGGKAGGAAIGAALGTMIPIPVVGTLLGGIVGAKVGEFFTKGKADAADMEVENRKVQSHVEARRGGILDFNDQKSFNEAAQENLEKIHAAGGDAQAVQDRYNNALQARYEQIEKQKAGEEVSDAEREAIQDQLDRAAMALVGTRFKTIEAEEDNRRRLEQTNEQLNSATKELAAARAKLAKGQKDIEGLTEADQREGSLRTRLGVFADGPMGAAVNLASEQNLMLRDINSARSAEVGAEQELQDAKESGADDATIERLTQKLEKAGDVVKDKVTDAAVSFAVKMKEVENSLEANREKQIALQNKFQDATVKHITAIATKDKASNILGLGPAVKNLENVFKSARASEKFRIKSGQGAGFTQQESMSIARELSALMTALKNAGFENINQRQALEILGPKLGKEIMDRMTTKFDEDGNMVGGRGLDQSIYGAGVLKEFERIFGGKAGDKLNRLLETEGLSDEKATEALNEEQQQLVAQLRVSKENFRLLNESMPAEGGITEEIRGIAGSLKTASTSFETLRTFSTKISGTVVDTAGVIEQQAAFVEEQKGLIKSLTKQISSLKTQVELIEKEAD